MGCGPGGGHFLAHSQPSRQVDVGHAPPAPEAAKGGHPAGSRASCLGMLGPALPGAGSLLSLRSALSMNLRTYPVPTVTTS